LKITERLDDVLTVDKKYYGDITPPPKAVKIEITGSCQLNCRYCIKSEGKRPAYEIDRALFEKVIDDLVASRIKEVGLFWIGEPFLVRWLSQAVAYCKKAGIDYVFITSNGIAATPDRVLEVMEAGLDSLKFSLNYANSKQFGEISGARPEIFSQILGNIQAAKAVRDRGKFKCGVFASYIRYNDVHAATMAHMIKHITPFVDEVYALEICQQSESITEGQRAGGWNVSGGNTGRTDNKRPPLPCWAVHQEAHIDCEGNVVACFYNNDRRFFFGNLKDRNFMDCWNDPEFVKLRLAHQKGDVGGTPCERCVAER
jgi:MoaA/NifB/PqqE/SkfB family radical SAM enzyme